MITLRQKGTAQPSPRNYFIGRKNKKRKTQEIERKKMYFCKLKR